MRCRVHTPAGEIPTETRVSVLAFSPARASHIVSSGAPDTHISLWDAETAAEIQRFQDHNQRVWSLAFSQKQPTVFASGSDDCTLRLWSTEQQRSTLTIGFDTNVCCVAACPWDAHMFAAGTAGHSMAVYDVRYPAAPVSNLTGAHIDACRLVGWQRAAGTAGHSTGREHRARARAQLEQDDLCSNALRAAQGCKRRYRMSSS